MRVTAHDSYWQDAAEVEALQQQHKYDFSQQQWRVLRFHEAGTDSEQSVARTTVSSDGTGASRCQMQAGCLAFQYTKTIAAVGELSPGHMSCVLPSTIRLCP